MLMTSHMLWYPVMFTLSQVFKITVRDISGANIAIVVSNQYSTPRNLSNSTFCGQIVLQYVPINHVDLTIFG